jgi:two-component system response regulator VanR
MVTALTEDSHQLDAFNSRADDYVTKPFSMPILIKRVEALLRRSGILQNEIRVGEFVLRPELYKVNYREQDISLTPREFDILLLLANNKEKILSHEVLLTRIWGYDYEGDERIVHTYIKNLRSKLPVNIIKTVRGVGYRLEEDSI